MSRTFSMTDGEVLETSGLDALMLIKFFEMAATLFVALTVLGLGILLPVNFTSHGDVSDSFDQLSMANIPQGSRRFWAHLLIGYLFSAAFYYLAWHTWRSYLNLRHQFLARWTLLGGNHTLLVHNLPAELQSDKALHAFFPQLDIDICRLFTARACCSARLSRGRPRPGVSAAGRRMGTRWSRCRAPSERR